MRFDLGCRILVSRLARVEKYKWKNPIACRMGLNDSHSGRVLCEKTEIPSSFQEGIAPSTVRRSASCKRPASKKRFPPACKAETKSRCNLCPGNIAPGDGTKPMRQQRDNHATNTGEVKHFLTADNRWMPSSETTAYVGSHLGLSSPSRVVSKNYEKDVPGKCGLRKVRGYRK